MRFLFAIIPIKVALFCHIPAGTLFPSYAMTNLYTANGNPVYIMYETQTDVTFYKQADGSWKKPYVEEETSVTSVKVQIGNSESDVFTVFSLSNHDYAVELDNYGGTAVSTKEIFANGNFYTHVLVNDVAIGSTGEAYVNVWGNKGAIGIRTSAGLNTTKITILKGCQIPSYAELLTGERKIFVTTEDVTFVKNSEGVFVKELGVNEYIEVVKTELDNYKAGLFREAEEAQRVAIVAGAKANLTEDITREEVDEIVAQAKAEIDQLKTANEYANEELAEVKESAIVEINAYKLDEIYFVEQQNERAKVIESFKSQLSEDNNEEEIAETIAWAKENIDKIQNKAQVIESAKAEINAYKGEDGYFKETEKAIRDEIVETAKTAIDSAETQTAINGIIAEAKSEIDDLFTANEYYVTSDVAMFARVAGWYGNGNFTLAVTLGFADWTNEDAGVKTYDGDLSKLLNKLGFFNYIKLGDKTLAEWGCTACYDNGYELNTGEPDNIFLFHLAMGQENMDVATAAGISGSTFATILEGALIPSYGYLTKTSEEVYRAGCDYELQTSTKAYGLEANGKTTVEGIKYVRSHDGTCGYLGISLVGDDYLGNGDELTINQDYYFDNKFVDSILVNGETGKVGYYGLFNLGENGMGYYAFQIFVPEEEIVSITIPAGAKFPSRAMTDLLVVNGNPVYIMYEIAETITIYKTENGYGTYAEVKGDELNVYKAGLFREAEEAQRLSIIALAKDNMAGKTEDEIDAILANAKTQIDALKTSAQYADEELAGDKQSAVAEIEGYKAGNVYLEEQATAKAEAIVLGKENVAMATTLEEIALAVSGAKATIDELPTKEEVISSAISEVEGYMAEVEYLEAQATQKATIVNTAKTEIQNATTKAIVDQAVANAKSQIDELPTKAEVEAEQLAQDKETANLSVDGIKREIDFDLYDEEEIEIINGLYATVKNAIETATNKAEIDNAVAEFETVLSQVPTKGEKESANNSSSESGSTGGGCSGAVGAFPFGLALLLVASRVIFKKKEN